jgi:hypothetical protein
MVHALALGVPRRQAKDGYDYTQMCMFVCTFLLIVDWLSSRNLFALFFNCIGLFHPQPYIVLEGRAAALCQSTAASIKLLF